MKKIPLQYFGEEVYLTGRWCIRYYYPGSYELVMEVYSKKFLGIKEIQWADSTYLYEINTCGE